MNSTAMPLPLSFLIANTTSSTSMMTSAVRLVATYKMFANMAERQRGGTEQPPPLPPLEKVNRQDTAGRKYR